MRVPSAARWMRPSSASTTYRAAAATLRAPKRETPVFILTLRSAVPPQPSMSM